MRFFKKKSRASLTGERPSDQAMIDHGLRAIYLDAKGQVPNLDTFERTRSWRMAWFFGGAGAVCILLAAVAWAGFWIFAKNTNKAPSALAITLHGPTEVSLGEEETYDIEWRNTSLQPLNDVDIRFNTPADFTVTQLEPSLPADQPQLWRLGLVQPQTTGHILVKGFFVGTLGGQTSLQILSTYHSNRLEAVSEQTQLATIHYTGTVLAGNILFPDRVLAGEPTQVRYVIANLGKQSLDHLVAKLTFPVGFIPNAAATGTSIDIGSRIATFPIGTLTPGSFYTAALPGLFASEVSGDAIFQAETGKVGTEGSLLVAAKSEARLVIAPGDLTVHLVVNGGDTSRSIEPGEPIHATLAYKNVSTQTVRDVQVTFQLESIVNGRSATGTSLIQWAGVDDPKQGASSTRPRLQTLRYDKTVLPYLAEFKPGMQDEIDVGWPTRLVTSGTKDALVRLTAITQVLVAGEKTPRLIRSQPITLTYRSDADVDVVARYFTEEGAPIGTGPLPPVSGKATTYRIYWNVHKSLHDLNNTSVSAVLPKIVTWMGKTNTSIGELTYDEKTRTVQWEIGRIADATHHVEGWFEISLTPQSIDIGRFATLVGETSLHTQDGRLNEDIHRTKPALSTDLTEDDGAKNKGVVRKDGG